MKKTPIKRREFQKALKRLLGINYRCRFLEMKISPRLVEWWVAVSELNDPNYKWQPKVIIFNDYDRTCGLWNGLFDNKPTIIDAATILAIGENALQKK